MIVWFVSFLFPFMIFAKPYPDPQKVIGPNVKWNKAINTESEILPGQGSKVLRVEVNWKEGEFYSLGHLMLENSGTPGLIKSALKKDHLGSYKASLQVTTATETLILHSSIGTGREFRRLVRTLAFRFPLPLTGPRYLFTLEVENPTTGVMQKVLEQEILPENFQQVPPQQIKVTLLKKATSTPSIKFNFYAEGYSANGEKNFLDAARKAITVLEKNVPSAGSFEFRGVFAPSTTKLGSAQDLGAEPKVRDSFLGLYFPHWRKFGRWYHVVYPTSETKYRNALAQMDYDYPLALVDDGEYWGVGNYKELTAVPSKNDKFSYLLLHEFGHFMGLNEEYEGGGPTELEFAEGIKEPWSQNITFNTDPLTIKWRHHLEPGITIPTSLQEWARYGGALKNPVGAYKGGYADSLPRNTSHKPVRQCMMGQGGDFCEVCQEGLAHLIQQDAGP